MKRRLHSLLIALSTLLATSGVGLQSQAAEAQPSGSRYLIYGTWAITKIDGSPVNWSCVDFDKSFHFSERGQYWWGELRGAFQFDGRTLMLDPGLIPQGGGARGTAVSPGTIQIIWQGHPRVWEIQRCRRGPTGAPILFPNG